MHEVSLHSPLPKMTELPVGEGAKEGEKRTRTTLAKTRAHDIISQ